MYEVIRWVSIALMWVAVGMNLWSFIRSQRAYKGFEATAAEYRRLISYYKGRPPVVYCYECEYFDKVAPNDKGFLICPASGMDVTGHDYCSFADRKKERGVSGEGNDCN